MSGDHNMHQKPKALELADRLKGCAVFDFDGDFLEAEAALRRLHEENEAKDALLRQALEALEQHCMAYYRHEEYRDDAIAAIKEHLK